MSIFLSKPQKRRYYRRLRMKLYCYAGLLTLLVVGALYLFLNLPFLHIKKFDVAGSADFDQIRGELLKGSLARFLGFQNFFSWPNEISGLKVEKDFLTGTLRIVPAPADHFAIWCGKDCYWVDRSGQLIEKAPDTEGSAIPKITDQSEQSLKISAPVMPIEAFANLTKIVDGLNQLSLGISDYQFNARLQELRATTVRDEKLIFSLRFTPSAKLFSYLKELIDSGKLHTAEYLDFTVENRIYLKSR